MRTMNRLAAVAAGAILLGAQVPAAAAGPTPTPLTVALVQAELRAKGARVDVTGALDGATQAAIYGQGVHTVGQLDQGAPDATVLQPGSTGPAVRLVQQALGRDGYPTGTEDGTYGPATAAAVRAFQRASQLPATGAVDVTTLRALAAPDPNRVIAPESASLSLVATAYGPSRQDNYPYGPVDLFGRPLKPGVVAVDPRVIPIGTRLWISGYHDPNLPAGGFLAVAADTGGAIRGHRVDIFLDGGPAAVAAFGVQHVTATVVP
jgi:3D (Asp-Asp-Asp) domain-containing protein